MRKIFLILFIFSFSFSCVFQKRSPMEVLFKTKIGFGENELGFISKNGSIGTKAITVSYKNGFYYIADATNNKILRTTEKGELLLAIYNPDFNPALKPTKTAEKENSETVVFVKLYKDYPVYEPSNICADIDKNIYFVNNLPSYKKFDEDGSFASQMILKFNGKGELLFELGRNGIGSTPFGYIYEIATDNKENLIVRENSNDGILIYKFSKDGALEKKVKITKGDVPLTAKENGYLIEIIDVKIGYFENEIYVTSQFVKESKEVASLIKHETVYEKIMKYSIASQKFEKLLLKNTPQYVDISKLSDKTDIKDLYGNKEKIVKPMESFIGMDETFNLFLSQKDIFLSNLNMNNEILYVYSIGGRMLDNIYVTYPPDCLYASSMFFSPNGRIYSYYIKGEDVYFILIK